MESAVNTAFALAKTVERDLSPRLPNAIDANFAGQDDRNRLSAIALRHHVSPGWYFRKSYMLGEVLEEVLLNSV
jgi:hypothetical protein